jgi:hypothetical protein
MAKLRIPKIGLLDWLAKGEDAENAFSKTETQPIVIPRIPSQNETQPIATLNKASIRETLKNSESQPLMANNLDLDGETLLVERWNCIPELTVAAEEPSEVVPSLAVKEKPKTSKDKSTKIRENRSAKAASQADPEQSHPFANFSAESLQVIASNIRTPTSTLCWLATHFNPDVRATVAKNSSALPETIWLLAKDYDEAVRLSVAEHQLVYEKVLKALCHDESPLVCWHAKQTLDLFAKQMADQSEEVRGSSRPIHQTADVIAIMQERLPIRFSDSVEEIEFLKLIAGKTTTPGYRLATLAKHPNPEIRGLVAENTNAPQEVFWLLAKDTVVEVKAKLTDNYNCPVEVLEHLQDDPDSYVAWQSKNIITKLLGKDVPAIFEDDSSLSSQRLLHTQ